MRGGARQGAGRKKHSVNHQTKVKLEMVAAATAQGVTPLDFMLDVLRDKTKPFTERFDAAKSAAPYMHPRLAAVEHSGNADKPVETRTRVEHVIIDAAADSVADNPDARTPEARATH